MDKLHPPYNKKTKTIIILSRTVSSDMHAVIPGLLLIFFTQHATLYSVIRKK